MTYLLRTISAVVVLTIFIASVACDPMGDLAESHIKGNVPDQTEFHVFLKRDLEQYFKEVKKKEVSVHYEFLRDGPTQSGTGFPKFYLWVVVVTDKTDIEEGAVKVAAIQRKQFAVHDYVSKSEVERNINDRDFENLYRVFPAPIADKITEKAAGGVLAQRPRDSLTPNATAPYMQTADFKRVHEWLESDFWRLLTPEQRVALLAQDKAAILETITSDKDYWTLSNQRYWCAKNPADIIPDLIKLLTDPKVVGLVNTADLIIWERIRSGDLQFYGHGGSVPDDIFSVAGRASWLLREITGQDFGSVSMKSTPAQLQQLSDSWRAWYEKNPFSKRANSSSSHE